MKGGIQVEEGSKAPCPDPFGSPSRVPSTNAADPCSAMQLSSPAEHPYGSRALGSKYQGQMGPTPSRYYENYHRSSASHGSSPKARPPTADALRQWLTGSRHQGSVALFAAALGVKPKTVEDWVYGRATPSSRHWARLYQETGLPHFERHQRELQGPQS